MSSLSPARAELSLVPPSGVLAASFSKAGGGFDTRDALLFADVLFAIVLLTLAALPAGALAHVRLAAVVEARRRDLALAGAATLTVAVLAKFLT